MKRILKIKLMSGDFLISIDYLDDKNKKQFCTNQDLTEGVKNCFKKIVESIKEKYSIDWECVLKSVSFGKNRPAQIRFTVYVSNGLKEFYLSSFYKLSKTPTVEEVEQLQMFDLLEGELINYLELCGNN